jgi:hypothetical protein
MHKEEDSSVGRAAVSKTEGHGFKSPFSCFCDKRNYLLALIALIAFFLYSGNLQKVKKVAGLIL